jgi:WD40 repeat protein
MKRKYLGNAIVIVLVILSFAVTFSTTAQSSPATITAQNIQDLHSVKQIDFEDWASKAGTVQNGWFALNPDGDRLALMNREGDIVVANDAGQLIDRYSVPGSDNLPTTVLDMAFSTDTPEVVSAHAEGGAYYVAYRHYDTRQTEYFRFSTTDVPLRIWDSGNVWLEVSPADYIRTRYIQSLTPAQSDKLRANEVLPPDSIHELPSGPENDPDSFLRIGRIEAPFAITVTQNFLVKLWNLETNEVLETAQLDALPGAGQLSPDGRYFAWRDGESRALHLLDFQTGQDKLVASLEGIYIPFLLLNSSADVIIGVNVALKPVVIAWDITTGERVDLGEYRSCTRQPDMVRLSGNNKSLIIGCDKGVDIWRISR